MKKEPVYPIYDLVLRQNSGAILYRCELLDPDNNYVFYKVVKKEDRSFWTCINISDAYKLFDELGKENTSCGK